MFPILRQWLQNSKTKPRRSRPLAELTVCLIGIPHEVCERYISRACPVGRVWAAADAHVNKAHVERSSVAVEPALLAKSRHLLLLAAAIRNMKLSTR